MKLSFSLKQRLTTLVNKVGWKHIIITIVGLALLGTAGYFLDLKLFSAHQSVFLRWFTGLEGWFQMAGLFGLIVAEVLIAPLPGGWLVITAGSFFGPWQGFAVAYPAAVLGSVLAFEASRWLGQPFVKGMMSEERFVSLNKKIQQSNKGLVLLYMIPLFPVDYVTVILGLTSISRKRFYVTVALGLLVNVLVLTRFGWEIAQPEYRPYLIAFISIVVVYFIGSWLWERLRAQPKDTAQKKK